MTSFDGDLEEMRELKDLERSDLASLAAAFDRPIEAGAIRGWAAEAGVFTRLASTPARPSRRISVISSISAFLATTFGKAAVAAAVTAAAATGGLAATDHLPGQGTDPASSTTVEPRVAALAPSVAEAVEDDDAVEADDHEAVENDQDNEAVEDDDDAVEADDHEAVENDQDNEAVENDDDAVEADDHHADENDRDNGAVDDESSDTGSNVSEDSHQGSGDGGDDRGD